MIWDAVWMAVCILIISGGIMGHIHNTSVLGGLLKIVDIVAGKDFK